MATVQSRNKYGRAMGYSPSRQLNTLCAAGGTQQAMSTYFHEIFQYFHYLVLNDK